MKPVVLTVATAESWCRGASTGGCREASAVWLCDFWQKHFFFYHKMETMSTIGVRPGREEYRRVINSNVFYKYGASDHCNSGDKYSPVIKSIILLGLNTRRTFSWSGPWYFCLSDNLCPLPGCAGQVLGSWFFFLLSTFFTSGCLSTSHHGGLQYYVMTFTTLWFLRHLGASESAGETNNSHATCFSSYIVSHWLHLPANAGYWSISTKYHEFLISFIRPRKSPHSGLAYCIPSYL